VRASRIAGASLLLLIAASGCGGGSPPGASSPGLVVMTGLYPLAQAVDQIGQGRADAVDVVPTGTDPRSYEPGAGATAQLARAALVLLGPAGVQPALDSATEGYAGRVVHVVAPSGGTYYWLDPAAMREAVPQIASAMENADPSDAGTFRSGAVAFEDALGSTDIDYESTISTCPRRDLFAPDVAFAQMAQRYGLTLHVVAGVDQPQSAVIRSAAAAIRASGATTVFVETWAPQQTVRAAAAAAGVKVRTLDTLLGPPPGGWPRQATYINLLEANLGALSSALGCPDLGSGA
jgi:ABC-type Zn uptake system ZnuABC Zn-binding protein ZnuA